MTWVLVAYWGAVMIGLVAVGILGPDLADPETAMPLLAKAPRSSSSWSKDSQ